jgi:cytochrome c553
MFVFCVNYAGDERRFAPEQCLVMLLAGRQAARRDALRSRAPTMPHSGCVAGRARLISLPSDADRATQLAVLRAARAAGFDAHLVSRRRRARRRLRCCARCHGPSNTNQGGRCVSGGGRH